MENERISDFVAMENSILTLSLVRDNLYLVSEGMNAMNSEPRSSNAVALNGEILDSTVRDLKEIFRRIEKLEHDNACSRKTDN